MKPVRVTSAADLFVFESAAVISVGDLISSFNPDSVSRRYDDFADGATEILTAVGKEDLQDDMMEFLFAGLVNSGPREAEAFKMLSLPPDADIVFWAVDRGDAMREIPKWHSDGHIALVDLDDYGWNLYRVQHGGSWKEAVASFYVSTRGALYQAEFYHHAEKQTWKSNNLDDDTSWRKGNPFVAEDQLLGESCAWCNKRPLPDGESFCSTEHKDLHRKRLDDHLKEYAGKMSELKEGESLCYRCSNPMTGMGTTCPECLKIVSTLK